MTPSAVDSVRPMPGIGSAARRILAPSYSDLLFIAMIVWLFILGEDAWSRLLVDGDTGWHIRVGERILDGHGIPKTDFLSLTKFGETWFAWEWGAEVIYAWLHRAWGLKGIVILSGVQIALFAVILTRFMVWRGANPLAAVGLTLLGAGAGSLHYLARPHLFTLVLLPAAIWLLERDRRHSDRVVWTLVPVTAVWTNLHGGFLALIACIGLLVVAELISRNWNGAIRYGTLGAACGLATFVNPYGYHLHEHVFNYLQSDWIKDVIEEFQSPRFRSENLMQFEALLLLGVMSAAVSAWKRNWVHAMWILFWAHQSLVSVRHATVFVTVATPVIAAEMTALWQAWAGGASRKSVLGIFDSLASEMAPGFRWTSLWPAGFVTLLLTADFGSKWPQDFPTLRFPVKTIESHAAKLRGQRVFTTDEWADYLLYKFYPDQRAFFDGRSDFYGPLVGKEYIRLTGGGHDWKQLIAKHDFRVALLPPDVAIATLLKTDADWRIVADDGKAIVFERIAGLPKTPGAALMKSVPPSELPKGDLAANGWRTSRPSGEGKSWN
jgi:hypothetical protein